MDAPAASSGRKRELQPLLGPVPIRLRGTGRGRVLAGQQHDPPADPRERHDAAGGAGGFRRGEGFCRVLTVQGGKRAAALHADSGGLLRYCRQRSPLQ